MLPTISNVSDVRAEGVLQDSSATGAIQDNQIDGALAQAWSDMTYYFTEEEYESVRTYAGVDPALVRKKRDWLHAECSFALAELASILSNEQFVQNGFAKEKSVGQSKITLATPQDIDAMAKRWWDTAIIWLKPYLSTNVVDGKGKVKAFRTKDRKLTIIAI